MTLEGFHFIPNRRKIFQDRSISFDDGIFEDFGPPEDKPSIARSTNLENACFTVENTSSSSQTVHSNSNDASTLQLRPSLPPIESNVLSPISKLLITSPSFKNTPPLQLVINSNNIDEIIRNLFSRGEILNAMKDYCHIFYYPCKMFHSIRIRKTLVLNQTSRTKINQNESGKSKEEFYVSDRVGKGSFGQALLISKTLSSGEAEEYVIKLDESKYSVNWESFVHTLVSC